MKVVMSVKPDAPVGEKWALHISDNDEIPLFANQELITLQGFATSFDAWVFCFCHLGIDVSVSNGCSAEWTYHPRINQEPKQIKMF